MQTSTRPDVHCAHLGRGLLEFGVFHQQLVGGALVALDLLLLNLLHQSFLFGFQQVQLLKLNKALGIEWKYRWVFASSRLSNRLD